MSKLDCGIHRAETVMTVRKRKDRKRSTYELLLYHVLRIGVKRRFPGFND